MGDFVIFSCFFRISRLEGFLYSVAPQGDRKSKFPWDTRATSYVERLVSDAFQIRACEGVLKATVEGL